MSTFLQIFLVVDVFLAGALAATALRHAYAHFRPPKPVKEKPAAPRPPELSPEVREKLLDEAAHDFKSALDNSSSQLEHGMEAVAERINKLLEQLGTEIISGELERYRTELGQLRQQAAADMGAIKDEIAKHEAELKARAAQEIETEKLRLIKQIDTKLADAVSSFLVETLQHNIDLGTQTAYLTAMLEEHKADLIKEVSG